MQEEELTKVANRSGFLFQTAAEEFVRQGSLAHGWEIAAHEYPWSTSDRVRSGFIDFVAEKELLRCVFECKRTQGAEWIFLVGESTPETVRLRTLWSVTGIRGEHGWGWDDIGFSPATLQSEFCIVRGASDDDKPMLERIAGDLVRAAESLAKEELAMSNRSAGLWGYVPVILTNATLYACRVDPIKVNRQTGTLPPSARFEEVPAIRFRKALPTEMTHSPDTYSSIKEGLRKKERSAVVVNIMHLHDWLAKLTRSPRSISDGQDPWAHLLR